MIIFAELFDIMTIEFIEEGVLICIYRYIRETGHAP